MKKTHDLMLVENENSNSKKFPYWIIFCIGIVVLILSIYFYKEYNETKFHELKGQYELLKDEMRKQKQLITDYEKERIHQRDSLLLVLIERERENLNLEIKNQDLEEKIKNLKDKPIVVPTDVPGLVNYFNKRYQSNENQIIEDKVGLGKNSAYKVSFELEEKDNLTEIVVIKDEQLKNKDTQIFLLNEDKKNLNTMFTSDELEILQRKKLQSIADDNIKNLEKQVENLNRNKILNKILIPVSVIVGGVIGHQIAK